MHYIALVLAVVSYLAKAQQACPILSQNNFTSVSAVYGQSASLIQMGNSSAGLAMLITAGWPWSSNSNPYKATVFDTQSYVWRLFQWPESNDLETLAAIRQRHFHGVVSSSDGKWVWLMGGLRGQISMNDLYELNVSDMQWRQVFDATQCEIYDRNCTPPTLPGRAGIQTLMLKETSEQKTIFVFGGVDVLLGNYLNDLYLLRVDLANSTRYTWTQISSDNAPSPRAFYAAASDGYNQVWLLGGSSDSQNPIEENSLHVYSYSQNLWFTLDGPQTNLFKHQMEYIPHLRQLLVFGGYTHSQTLNDKVWCFKLDSGTWTSWNSPLELQVASASASLIKENTIAVFGGLSHSNVPSNNLSLADVSNQQSVDMIQLQLTNVTSTLTDNDLMQVIIQGWGLDSLGVEVRLQSFMQQSNLTEMVSKSFSSVIINQSWNELVVLTEYQPSGTFLVSVHLFDNSAGSMSPVMDTFTSFACYDSNFYSTVVNGSELCLARHTSQISQTTQSSLQSWSSLSSLLSTSQKFTFATTTQTLTFTSNIYATTTLEAISTSSIMQLQTPDDAQVAGRKPGVQAPGEQSDQNVNQLYYVVFAGLLLLVVLSLIAGFLYHVKLKRRTRKVADFEAGENKLFQELSN